MGSHNTRGVRAVVGFALGVTLCSVAVLAQGGQGTAKPRAAREGGVPRTAWGAPDLQGIWTNTTTTPMQRPDDLAGKAVLTEKEREERDVQTKARNVDQKPKQGETGAYNQFWFERGVWTNQTSLVTDPPDGKFPAMTESGKKRLDAQVAHRKAHPADSWLDRGPYDRCITRGMPGAMVPGFYNHNYQIFQTKDYVAILVEMIHDARIIPLDGRPHTGARNGSWLGSSRGRWEGDVLVIETKNVTDKLFEFPPTVAFGTGPTMHVIERFRRVDADTIDYQFTVNDLATFTKPWTVSTPMTKTDGPIFEYACHEGNHAMSGILSAERTAEKDAASGKK
jgi:hypothetical protein